MYGLIRIVGLTVLFIGVLVDLVLVWFASFLCGALRWTCGLVCLFGVDCCCFSDDYWVYICEHPSYYYYFEL